MVSKSKYYFTGPIEELKLRLRVHKTSFENNDKEVFNSENYSPDSHVEETVIKWISKETNEIRQNSIISYNFEDESEEVLNNDHSSDQGIQKFIKILRKMFVTSLSNFENTSPSSKLVGKQTLIIRLKSNETNDYFDESNIIWKITLNKNSILTFVPPLTTKGISVHGRFGECRVTLQVIEIEKPLVYKPSVSFDTIMLLKELECHVPEYSDKTYLDITYHITIEKAFDAENDGIFVDWYMYSTNQELVFIGPKKGRTLKCYKNSNNVYHFGEAFSVKVLIPRTEVGNFPRLKLRITSEDDWGRQNVDSVGSVYLLPCREKNILNIHTWSRQPLNSYEQLSKFFLGRICNDTTNDIYAMSGGKVTLSVRTIIYDHVEESSSYKSSIYSSLENYRLKPSLFWRIMKVLMEFEEARQQLLIVNKNK